MNAIESDGRELPKCPTGIQGLDEVTGGGLPRGRPTLVCGSAGCGRERSARAARSEEIGRLERAQARRRDRLEAQIQDLRRAFASEAEDLENQLRQRQEGEAQERSDAEQMAASRYVVLSPRGEST